MRTTRKFQSAVAELVAWLEGKDKPGYASDTDFIDPAFEDMVDLQQKRKRLDELIRTVKDSTWTLPTKRFAHDEEFQKTFGFPKDSNAARFWMSMLDLPDWDELFETGQLAFPERVAIAPITASTVPRLGESLGFHDIQQLVKQECFPEDTRVLGMIELAYMGDRPREHHLILASDKFGEVIEGYMPPKVTFCFQRIINEETFKESTVLDGIELTGTDAWVEGTHNFEDGRYR